MSFLVDRYGGVEPFVAAAGDFLVAREAENNLILGLCTGMRLHPEFYADPPPTFATVRDGSGSVVLATLRTPPYNQVLSATDAPAAAELLADALAADELPGVLGPTVAAARFAERWAAATGRSSRIVMRERIHRLRRVVPPRPVTGSWRYVEARDRELIIEWVQAFGREAMPHQPVPGDLGPMAERWIAQQGRWGYLWEDGGRPVSLVGAGGETPNGIRIGPVYTPPSLRGRGYASNLTAAASQDQLDRGRSFCFLYTDLANPTSNHIYAVLGYEPVIDVDEHSFGEG